MRQAAKPPLTLVIATVDVRVTRSTLERDVPPALIRRMLAAATLAAGITLIAIPPPGQAAPAVPKGEAQPLCAAPAPGTFGCFARRHLEATADATTPEGYG